MNKYLKVLGVFAIATVLFSCEKEEDVAAIVIEPKPNMTIDMAAAINAQEGDEVPFTLNFDAPVGRAFTFFVVRLNESTATADDSSVDESYPNNAFQQKFTVPAGALSFTDKIVINNDIDNDDNETLVLSIGDSRTSAAIFTPKIVTITIGNVVSDELSLEFFYDRTFGADNQFSLCDLESDLSGDTYDVDFLLYTEAGVDTGNTSGQTGACNEKITMDLADYADGIYYVTAFLYTNADLELAEIGFPVIGIPEFNIPVAVGYTRSGSFKGTYNQDAADYFTSNSAVSTENYVVSIEIYTDVVDGLRKFKVYNDTSGVVSGMGKHAKKAKINKRK